MFVANKRADNKVQIGGYIDLATEAGIKLWLSTRNRLTKTDFLVDAIVEKLEREGIELPPEAGSRQRPLRPNPLFDTSPAILNDASSAKTASSTPGAAALGAQLLDGKLSEAERRGSAKKLRSGKAPRKAKAALGSATPPPAPGSPP